MSRSKYGQSTLAGLVDSDSDSGQFISGMPTPDSGVENMAPAKKGRGRPKAAPAKVAKAKAPARRTSGRLNAKAKIIAPEETRGKRKALADRTNQQCASDTEEVEEFEQSEDILMGGDELENKVIAVRATKPKAAKKTAAGRGKVAREVSHTNYSIDANTPDAPRLGPRVTKKVSAKEIPEEPSPVKTVQETQGAAMDVGEYGDEEVEQAGPKRPHKARPKSVSPQRQPSVPRRRAGSASDTERSDPALRRKLGEMTKKYETLNIKYQDMREIGLKEAERNFERLKKQSEDKTKSNSEAIFTVGPS
jgi:hypothetical protein